MKQFLITFFAVILAGFFLFMLPLIIIGAIASAAMTEPEYSVKPHTIVTLDLSQTITDRDMDSPAYRVRNAMSGAEATHGLNSLSRKLDAAAANPDVAALYIKGTSADIDMANMCTLRHLINYFRATSGKPVYFFDEAIGSDKVFYIASAADSIFVAPQGSIALYGAVVSKVYFKRLAEKFGIGFDVLKHGRYKSAVEPYFRTSMSDDDRAQSQRIVDIVWSEVRDSIAAARNVDPARLDQYVNNLEVFSTPVSQSAEIGLIDQAIYFDQFEQKLANAAHCPVADLHYQDIYELQPDTDTNTSDPQIAIVYAQGQIYDGSDPSDEANIYADDLAQTLRDLRADSSIAAVVLRVNSPGGSALASDLIWREVKLLAQQKTIVTSMGGYAASGGYYISCAANYILAEPTTITGSIGVFGMVPNVEKAANDLGVDVDIVGSSKSPILTGLRALKDNEKTAILTSIENTYNTFVSRVAEGRDMTFSAVDSIAQGRVWMGLDAANNGLVDNIGNIYDAIDAAAELAELPNYHIVEYPIIDDSTLAALKAMGLSVSSSLSSALSNSLTNSLSHYLFGHNNSPLTQLPQQLQSPLSPTQPTILTICDLQLH